MPPRPVRAVADFKGLKIRAPGGSPMQMDPLKRLSALLPPDVALGFHFCFGTFGGWPSTSISIGTPEGLRRALPNTSSQV